MGAFMKSGTPSEIAGGEAVVTVPAGESATALVAMYALEGTLPADVGVILALRWAPIVDSVGATPVRGWLHRLAANAKKMIQPKRPARDIERAAPPRFPEVLVYEMPVPGIPVVTRVPRRPPKVTRTPRPPNDVVTPLPLKFKRTPGKRRIVLRNRQPISLPRTQKGSAIIKQSCIACWDLRLALEQSAVLLPYGNKKGAAWAA